MSACQCHDGIICDACAASLIEERNLLTADYVELTPGLLTGSEQSDLQAAVSVWLSSLTVSQAQEQ
jgi:hypothetical protein